MGRHGYGEKNENGEKFANLCATNSLVIGGTLFSHKRIHKNIWVPSDQFTENQIDSCAYRESLDDHSVTSEP